MKEQGRKQTEVIPELFAATFIPMAAAHVKNLVEALQKEASQQEKDFLDEEDTQRMALEEAFLAYFCLASFLVYRYFGDFYRWNKYGAAMLTSLRHYPEPTMGYVRELFCNNERVDEAVDCYVNDRPSEQVREDLDAVWKFLQLSEDNPLGIFAAKLHVRVMRILGVPTKTFPFYVAWLSNSAGVVAAWEAFSSFHPVLKS
jgi:hypothetical protein